MFLNHHEVHIYWTNLDLPLIQIEAFLQILSADEQERANRFRFAKDRNRYIVSRGVIRTLLGQYLKLKPNLIKFVYNSKGKPSLELSLNSLNLNFNLSHSQGLGLYGITQGHLIGVDLEYIKPLTDGEKIAKRFFSPQEYQIISRLPQSEKQQAFFKGWTAKEAFLKATGEGLSNGLDQVEFELQPEQPFRLLKIQGDATMASQWSLFSFTPVTDAIATILVQGQHQYQFKTIQLDPADLGEF
jgi:4'-phosphopantetheinyl transferase